VIAAGDLSSSIAASAIDDEEKNNCLGRNNSSGLILSVLK